MFSASIKSGLARAACASAAFALLSLSANAQQQPAHPVQEKPGAEKAVEPENKQPEANKRVEMNLLGKTDAASGESRRNENVQFNLVDNNALKELNVRLGTTATIVREFNPASGYFGAEFGAAPKASITLPAPIKSGFHGRLYETHLNSVTSARSFFQVGGVKPARENEYGFNFGLDAWSNARLFVEASQQKIRGSVNGNVLVPKPDERTPLATDPATRAVVAKFLAAYPKEPPNRTDINPRALNTNAPQSIDNSQANIRLDQSFGAKDAVALQYQFTSQSVDAFQLVAGQNPNTDTRWRLARIVWTRSWSAKTITNFSVSYDRLTSLLRPDENAVGPYVNPSGLTILGPDGTIPLDRAQNQIRAAAQVRRTDGDHDWSAGFGVTRRQINGDETDAHRGYFSFSNDFGADTITNLRLGKPSQHIVSIGDVHRGFRLWETQIYASDKWRINPRLELQYGLRWQPVTRPTEVNNLNVIPYDSDWNNLAPIFGFAYRLPKNFGVARGAYGAHFGEIFFVTYQQIRFSPPLNHKIVVTAPDLLNPLGAGAGGQLPTARPTIYALDPELATPYSHQYNLSWEPEWNKSARLQFGYVGSRSHKLLSMWYLNRAHPVAGIPQTTATVNQRRPNPDIADYRLVVNAARGYFDAARVSLALPNWRGLTVDASYWFSKAIDLGSSYTNTANENDSRKGRSQYEYETHRDMKGPSDFDQTHAFLWRMSYVIRTTKFPRVVSAFTDGWNLSTVALIKTGIPFNIATGSDGPGFGNVDGNGADRPNLLDPKILGRTIADPDTSKQLLPRSAFQFINPTDARGNLGRNVFRKGPIRNVNASLQRSWGFRKDLRLTFRAESINLFNTPQFAEPGFELANPNFGAITNTLNEGRTFRFMLQIGW
ncbi:MAG TPA: TonB-dependent receptor [Blastocatellia bacterium]|nr:TonB-dependent receptor [Blastocatellia bacterium]